ncbi:acyl-coenzyme A oxidase peroxisomal [Raphidocelis subcapitata]|uniref:Acyl-coenzyme A oxidase peroxisomal n=1 Tax=Raphidocelis subcapitata TaxID=307507 RepID=A0A2V0PM63_9CHLO|nr:acyl-coenzyme A oxidase peroxisomal [Raphidocelis subcapitata]|eukprot:GBF98145.1 acyl-coenzyme A oxidase peroxisomal [Raphidocelis subcapitata]
MLLSTPGATGMRRPHAARRPAAALRPHALRTAAARRRPHVLAASSEQPEARTIAPEEKQKDGDAAAAANGNGSAAAAAAEAAVVGASASGNDAKSTWDPAAWTVPDPSTLPPLEFKPLSGGELAWARLKMAFALPWRRFKKGSVLTFKVVVLCCAIKPLCAWNAETCATTSRERCGGQASGRGRGGGRRGYLSVNRFGSLIGFAHAGMTAEGDNRVLMQKVSKELLSMMTQPALAARLASAETAATHLASRFASPAPGAAAAAAAAAASAGGPGAAGGAAAAAVLAAGGLADPFCLDTLRKLLLVREARTLKGLALAMRQAPHGGSFDEWMKHQSDAVQGAAKAYAEREVLDACLRVLDGTGPGPSGVAVTPAIVEALAPVVALFALSCVEADLAWFVSMEVVPPRVARLVAPQARRLVASLAPRAPRLAASFGIPDHLVAAPIAGDWVFYNKHDNQGELVGEAFGAR